MMDVQLTPMQLVEQHIIRREDKRFPILDRACFHAKNIYNAANYELRQLFFTQGWRMSYMEQEKRFKQKDLLPDQVLPMKVVQHVLKELHQDWDNFASANAEYQRCPEKFTGRPCLPHYKHKTNGRLIITFTNQAISVPALKKGEVVLSGLKVGVKTRHRQIDQVRVVPHSSHYVLEIVYSQPIKAVKLNTELYAGIDIGVDVLAALTSNKPGFKPILVNGRPLKALNQFYNKCQAYLQHQLIDGRYTSRRLQALAFARNRRIESLLHLASAYLIRLLVREDIGTLVIGKNDGWKQYVDMGKRNNQAFVYIPHARFIKMLTYKAKLVGLNIILTEESYTSKCSFLDREPICKQERYLGKRVKRGLFRASDGRSIHADLNASYNLIHKVIPNAFTNVATVITHTQRMNPLDMQKHLQQWRHAEVEGRTPL